MLAFPLIYFISAIAKTDCLGGAESFAYLAANTFFTNEVYFGSFGEGACGCFGFSGFCRIHRI
jgi:hypothetical protein